MAWTEPACILCKKEPGRDKLVVWYGDDGDDGAVAPFGEQIRCVTCPAPRHSFITLRVSYDATVHDARFDGHGYTVAFIQVPGEACCIQCGHVFDASTGCGREYMGDVAEPDSRKLNSTIIFCKACYTTRRSRRQEYAPFNHCVQRDYFEKTCGGIVRK